MVNQTDRDRIEQIKERSDGEFSRRHYASWSDVAFLLDLLASPPQPLATTDVVVCKHCGEEIRLMDGSWCDCETHSTCIDGRAHEPAAQCEDSAVVNAITAIVREADRAFEKGGGGSRHWVRDWFLPYLNRAGWEVARLASPAPALSGEQE